MSMFGWQLMALKSARTAGLEVPIFYKLDCVHEMLFELIERLGAAIDLNARNTGTRGGCVVVSDSRLGFGIFVHGGAR
jgi:hypothetical protein